MRFTGAVTAATLLVLATGCGPGATSEKQQESKVISRFAATDEHGANSGTVKSYSDDKGAGFISPDDGGRDLFVHVTQIVGTGYRSLTPGQRVWFDIDLSAKVVKAVNVSPADDG